MRFNPFTKRSRRTGSAGRDDMWSRVSVEVFPAFPATILAALAQRVAQNDTTGLFIGPLV